MLLTPKNALAISGKSVLTVFSLSAGFGAGHSVASCKAACMWRAGHCTSGWTVFRRASFKQHAEGYSEEVDGHQEDGRQEGAVGIRKEEC